MEQLGEEEKSVPNVVHSQTADMGKKRETGHRIFTNRSLQLDRIQFYGFDMDYTLVTYKSPEFEELAFRQVIEAMIEIGYPADIREFVYDSSFALRGLWYDKMYGNLLKVDAYGNILTVVHGFKFLSAQEVRKWYPNKYINESDRIHVYYTLFDVPEIYLVACLIDYFSTVATYLEDQTGVLFGKNVLSFRAIFNDIKSSMEKIHSNGSLKTIVCANLGKYIAKDDRLPIVLDRLRSHGAKTFLLTNSDYWYTDQLLSYTLTSEEKKRHWKSYFDFIIVDAKKPLFFAEGTPIRVIDSTNGSIKLGAYDGTMEQNEVYSGGSCDVVSKLIGAKGKDVLFVGDHLLGDIIKSKEQKAWRTMLIVPELNDELQVFHEKRNLFSVLDTLDASIGEVLRSLDMTAVERPDAVKNIKLKIQKFTHELDMSFGLFGSLFRTGSRQTYFASQLTRFADIYAPRVVNLLYYPYFYFFRAPRQLMPHESTIDPTQPTDIKPWGYGKGRSTTFDRERTLKRQATIHSSQLHRALTIRTGPILPLHVTHHDDDDDDGEEEDDNALLDQEFESDLPAELTYTPPKKHN